MLASSSTLTRGKIDVRGDSEAFRDAVEDGAAQRVGDAAPDEELLVIDGLGCLLGGHDGRGGPGWELNQFSDGDYAARASSACGVERSDRS